MIQINGTIRLGRSIDAATRKAIVEMVRASRAEDGCIDYAFASDLLTGVKIPDLKTTVDAALFDKLPGSSEPADNK